MATRTKQCRGARFSAEDTAMLKEAADELKIGPYRCITCGQLVNTDYDFQWMPQPHDVPASPPPRKRMYGKR